MAVPATLTRDEAARRTWDVAIVGAGPAGSLAARLCAGRGARVLLVDRCAFPREKVCGCCLNGAALSVLRACGLDDIPVLQTAPELHRLRLRVPGRTIDLPLERGVALSRRAFDTGLVAQAIDAGAAWLPEAHATVSGTPDAGGRTLVIEQAEGTARIGARVVVAADGLGGQSLRHLQELAVRVRPGSRVGGGLVLDVAEPAFARDTVPARGTISMSCTRDGYVGAVQLEDGRLNLAAALDVAAVRKHGGFARTVATILRATGVERSPLRSAATTLDAIASRRWRGTPLLTRHRRRVAAHRVLVIGDAGGYVEPFTGEGMAWALLSGMHAAPVAVEGARRWSPRVAHEWSQRHCRLLDHRQRGCRLITQALRRPAITRLLVELLRRFPALARPYLRGLAVAAE